MVIKMEERDEQTIDFFAEKTNEQKGENVHHLLEGERIGSQLKDYLTTVPAVAGGVLCEFLEVAFHLVLYVREVYPSVVFERRKKYNVPVQMCSHPDLNQYILDVLQTMRPLLEKKFQPIERFVFEIGSAEGTSKMQTDDTFLLHTERSLRGFLLKINSCDAFLQPLPPGCTFSILVYTKESSFLKLQEDRKAQEFPWVQADEGIEKGRESVMIPLKSTTSGVVKMQLFVEECVDKLATKQ